MAKRARHADWAELETMRSLGLDCIEIAERIKGNRHSDTKKPPDFPIQAAVVSHSEATFDVEQKLPLRRLLER
ncbi:MAG: hypothetical protein O3A08_13380 [Proteobacteria bacterium]|nr:hypothetical protein [Pseudomonadota bacterium]MDA1287381.1 hypothetical protein [Pseudomonadota bacterium]